jgi:hypothetical protein
MEAAEFSLSKVKLKFLFVYAQAWMMMAMAVSIFVPRSSKLLWFLRTHFNRCKDAKYVITIFIKLFLISSKTPFR